MLSSNHVLPTSGFSKLLFNDFSPQLKMLFEAEFSLFYFSTSQSVQSLSCVWLSATPLDCSIPGFPVHHQLLELAQMHVPWVGDTSNHFILCCPLLLLASVFPSLRVFPSVQSWLTFSYHKRDFVLEGSSSGWLCYVKFTPSTPVYLV